MSRIPPVTVDRVIKKFPGETLWGAPRWALKGVSFEVHHGETFGLIGQNGAGKSTLLRILSGLLRPSRGRAAIGGRSPRRPSARARLGYLPETPLYYPDLTVDELLRFQAHLYRVPAPQISGRINDAVGALGLERHRSTRAAHCSKGTLQRLAIAALLVPEPDIYILDEPFSGLDPSVRHRLNALIEMLQREGCTILLCAHELPEIARHCTRVGMLHAGKLAGIVDKEQHGGSADVLESIYLQAVGRGNL